MRALTWSQENRVCELDWLEAKMEEQEFTLGGNWEYDHGYFDRFLDEKRQVWVRVPFQVVSGRISGEETPDPDTTVRLGTPLVLKHLYEDGLDQDAMMHVTNALFDQFQSPVDEDASVEDKWVKEAQSVIGHLENALR